jgi:16S rRNA (cytosine967-C5)-methyltransferase
VLRRAARGELAPLPADDTPGGAAIAHSYPPWLVELWWERFGASDTRALLRAGNAPGELALRVNTLRAAPAAVRELLAQAGVALRGADGELPEAIVVDGAFDAHGHPLYAAGAYTAQSRGAMLVARALEPRPGERVLDLCAAPGGKTTHLAALMDGRGEIVAVERHPRRAAALQRTCERMGATSVRVVAGDARRFAAEAAFDRVLLDPPCSGLGTLQGHPDLRWRITPEGIDTLAAAQAQMLAAARAAVAPGGMIVYATCTLSPAENEALVRRSGLPLESERLVLPHRDRTDGFYIARLTA